MGPLSPIRIVVLIFVALAGLCLVAIPLLWDNLLPKNHSTQFIVSCTANNAIPDIVEQRTTSILRDLLVQLSQLKPIQLDLEKRAEKLKRAATASHQSFFFPSAVIPHVVKFCV